MLDEDVVALRPYQVYALLGQLDLIARRPREALTLTRPEPPSRPDEVWHIDLMYVCLSGRWYYLVDIIDGYSRFLVNWTLNTTMLAETVTLTVQQAVERLQPRPTEIPRIVHDHGRQFVSAEWRSLIQGSGIADIKTRVAHPQSNGVIERLHRTHREEAALDPEAGYHAALEQFARWAQYYNYRRPHLALKYLCPFDYYRGDPQARLADRRRKLTTAQEARAAYWRTGKPQPIERSSLTLIEHDSVPLPHRQNRHEQGILLWVAGQKPENTEECLSICVSTWGGFRRMHGSRWRKYLPIIDY
jgi:transposase InsO family protein